MSDMEETQINLDAPTQLSPDLEETQIDPNAETQLNPAEGFGTQETYADEDSGRQTSVDVLEAQETQIDPNAATQVPDGDLATQIDPEAATQIPTDAFEAQETQIDLNAATQVPDDASETQVDPEAATQIPTDAPIHSNMETSEGRDHPNLSPASEKSKSPEGREKSPPKSVPSMRSRSGSPRSRSRSSASRSVSPRSRSGSPQSRTSSRHSTRSRSPKSSSRSPRSRSGSGSPIGKRSRQDRSASGSRSRSRSRSSVRSNGSRSSRSSSQSRSRSRSGSRSGISDRGSDVDTPRKNKRIRAAFGDSDDSGDENEAKRIRNTSDAEEGVGAEEKKDGAEGNTSEGGVVNDPEEKVMSKEESNSQSSLEQLNLKVLGQDGQIIQFKMKAATPFRKLMHAYCDRQKLALNTIRFVFDGSRIKDTDTPKDHDMEDGDAIEVFTQQTGGRGTTTLNRKQFCELPSNYSVKHYQN